MQLSATGGPLLALVEPSAERPQRNTKNRARGPVKPLTPVPDDFLEMMAKREKNKGQV